MATVQGNAFESQNGAAVIQTSKIKPYRCDLRHVLALLKIWLFWMIFEPGHKTTGRCAFSQRVGIVFRIVVVIFSSVLCLLDILYFVPSLSEGNLFGDWAATMASLWKESSYWIGCEVMLSSSTGFPWKKKKIGLVQVGVTDNGQMRRRVPSSCPSCQYIRGLHQ